MLPRANCAFVLPDLVNEAYFPHTDYLTWPLHYNCSTDDLSKELYFQAASYEGNIVTYCETIASKWICRLTSFQNTETCCIEQISLNRLQQFLWSCLEKVVVGCSFFFFFGLEGGVAYTSYFSKKESDSFEDVAWFLKFSSFFCFSINQQSTSWLGIL